MKSFREIILFLQYVAANKEALGIQDVRSVLMVILIYMKNRDWVNLFYRFYRREVKAKTILYNQVLAELKTDQQRPFTKITFLGRFGANGKGQEEFERLRQFIYRYGKFNHILKEQDEDMWL